MAHLQLLRGAGGRLLCSAELRLRGCLRAPGLLSLCRDQSLCQWTEPPMPYGAVSERSLLSWAVLQSACICSSCRETSLKPDF